MYEPAHFKVGERAQLLAVIAANPLGMLITAGGRGLMANPVPFVVMGAVNQSEGEAQTLCCHVARANDVWREIADGAEPLVVFQGLEHYISPNWYATKAETHKVVPTWNYQIVQVRGKAHIRDNPEWVGAQIVALTRQFEAPRPAPWAVSDAPEAFVAMQKRGIVGIEIEMSSLIGKFKLSQNRHAADQNGVIAGLAQEGNEEASAMSAEIAAALALKQP